MKRKNHTEMPALKKKKIQTGKKLELQNACVGLTGKYWSLRRWL